jgi:putative membrane-bound dehydrogenase-like protein
VFRKTFLVKEPDSRLVLEVTADNAFELYLDGKEVARGANWSELQRVDVRLGRGEHVLAAVARNEGEGPAGFLVRGGLLPLGQSQPVHTDSSWKTSAKPAAGDGWKLAGYDDSGWSDAQDLGEQGVAPWGVLGQGTAGVAAGIRVAEGLEVKQVASPEATGSAVSFTFDAEGRPVVGIERGPVARLVDADRDGVYEGRFVIAPGMQNCQGLFFEADGTFWAVGQGPQGTGIYHWRDGDGDGVYETVLRHVATDGMGEHGPHAVLRGPDGSLYFNAGNHAHIKQEVDERSPVGRWFLYEGELLRHHGDPRGHAVNIRAPGGEIYRSDDDGASWQRVVGGFRNQYDFGFNRSGEIFSFDSDMEWDLGLPWYRPVRVNFCPPGAELGWRTGTAVWPAYSFDSVPAAFDVGRGSPTGVTFYQGRLLPQEYDDAFLFCDWSQGRILAARLEPAGAGYTGKHWELASGQPLNCTDIEVGPDGAVYFTTGGRGTLGGLYRVSPSGNRAVPRTEAVADPVLAAIVQASPQTSYGRRELGALRAKAGGSWSERLSREYALNTAIPAAPRIRALDLLHQTGERTAERALDGVFLGASRDSDPLVRAKGVQILGWRRIPGGEEILIKALEDEDAVVRRRAAEALVRIHPAAMPVEKLIGLLDDEDRWVRTSARVALEHGGREAFAGRAIPQTNPRTAMEYMLAEVRVTRPEGGRLAELIGQQLTLLEGLSGLETTRSTATERVDLMRLLALSYLLGKDGSGERIESARARAVLLRNFETAQVNLRHRDEGVELRVDEDALRAQAWESARLLAYLDEPRAVGMLLDAQDRADARQDRVTQIHYAYCLKDMKAGWTPESRRRMWGWFERASRWEGGFSFHGYLDYMIQDLLPLYPAEERGELLVQAPATPFPARLLVRGMDLEGEGAGIGRLEGLYKALDSAMNPGAVQELRNQVIEKLGGVKGRREESHRVLRAIAGIDPARRDVVARALANQPQPEDVGVLVAALESRDGNTIQQVLRGLEAVDGVPSGPDGLRGLIRLAGRVGGEELKAAERLARRWNPGVAVPGLPQNGAAVARFWTGVYHQKFPDGPAIEERGEKPAYTLVELVRGVVESGAVQRGSAERGSQVIGKARCLDCHKFGNQGQGLGPELTTVSSRFRPAEILESILEPSKVISDQYKSVTVALKDGQVLTGMPVGGDEKALVLLLSDGTRTTLAKEDVEEQKEAQVSVMPQGLLEPLSVQEIADLLALFEAQPRVPATASGAGGAGGK